MSARPRPPRGCGAGPSLSAAVPLSLVAALGLGGCRPGCEGKTRADDAEAVVDGTGAGDATSEGDGEPPRSSEPGPPAEGWARTFGGDGVDAIRAVAVDDEGRVYVAGSFSGAVNVDRGAGDREIRAVGGTDGVVAAFEREGGLRWVRTFGGPGADVAHDVEVLASGAVVVVGEHEGAALFGDGDGDERLRSAGRTDAFVACLDDAGTSTWVRTFGGGGWDRALSVAVGDDDLLVVTGAFSGRLDLDPGEGEVPAASRGDADLFVLALSVAGEHRWSRTLGGPGADMGTAVASTAEGSIFVAGVFADVVDVHPGEATRLRRSEGFSDLLLLVLDRAGDVRWAWTGGGPLIDRFEAVDATPDGGVWAAGFFVDAVTLDTSPEPTVLRSRGMSDALAVRFSADGRPLVGVTLGGEGSDYAYGAAVRGGRGIVMTGRFSGQVALSSPPSSLTLSSAGRSDVFVLALAESGGVESARRFGGEGLDRGWALAAGRDGCLVVGGSFGEVLSLPPPLSDAHPVSAGASDAFVVRMGE